MTQHWFDNSLASNRRQAIIWTNADPIHWRIYAARGGWVGGLHDWTLSSWEDKPANDEEADG